MKQGMYFTLDGIFAAFIIIAAAALMLTFTQSTPDTTMFQTTAADVLTVLNTLTVGELNSTIASDVLATNLTNESDSVLRAIAVLWATNSSLADDFTQSALSAFSTQYSYAIYAEGEQLAGVERTPQSGARIIASTKQQVSGIAAGRPVSGSTATAYLKKIENKTTNSFAYLGGFVGQGNLSVFLDLPSDVNASRILSLTLELDTPQEFELTINGDPCGTFVPVDWNMTPTVWDISACKASLGPGNNSIEFTYDNITTAYIAGGYIKASYTTDVFASASTNKALYRFPGINGVVNLYDAVIVPQTLRNMTVYLHYTANDPTVVTYLAIGEKTVWSSNNTGTIGVTLTDVNLTGAGLDYSFLSNKTVPIRFSSFNSTQTVLTGGNADIVVITDYSGSMKKDIDSDDQGNSGNIADCEGAIYPDDDIRRTHLARCLDKEVVDITLNYTGNRLWPVYFYDNVVYNYTNPQDTEALIGHYNTGMPPQGKEKTCLACALSAAYDIFRSNNQSNRSRFVILMSDGLPTHCTGAGCAARSQSFGSEICEGYCDTTGACSTPPSICTNSACASAIDNTLVVAQQLKDTFNATIFTVGFGPVGTCSNATTLLQRVANITNGTYHTSDDPDELRLIYQNISNSILEQLTLVAQTVQVPQNVTLAALYNDSYIEVVHDVPVAPPLNMIELTRQTPPFASCTPTVNLPSQLAIKEAHIVSYSGPHWTSLVTLNGNVVFNLTDFLVPYYRLGDPYRVFLPPAIVTPTSTFVLDTADQPDNSTGCSDNNSLVYTALVPSVTPRTAVLENAEGCTWTIEKDIGGFQVVPIPKNYAGANTCSYTNASISYDADDSLQEAVYQILRELDFDTDGRIFISLSEENLEVIVTKISSVPYLWGPSRIEVRVWQ